MKHVQTVAWRELRSLFVSPVAYGVLSLFAVLAGLFFTLHVLGFVRELERFEQFGGPMQMLNLSDHLIGFFYESMGMILLFLVPGVTMGLFARISPFTRFSITRSSRSSTPWKCEKSKRRRSFATRLPACLTWVPRVSRSAAFRRCVAV